MAWNIKDWKDVWSSYNSLDCFSELVCAHCPLCFINSIYCTELPAHTNYCLAHKQVILLLLNVSLSVNFAVFFISFLGIYCQDLHCSSWNHPHPNLAAVHLECLALTFCSHTDTVTCEVKGKLLFVNNSTQILFFFKLVMELNINTVIYFLPSYSKI